MTNQNAENYLKTPSKHVEAKIRTRCHKVLFKIIRNDKGKTTGGSYRRENCEEKRKTLCKLLFKDELSTAKL